MLSLSTKMSAMKYDDAIEMPEGDFIPGIFNYCDAWCDRCIYTNKCRVFASEKIIRREIDTADRIKASMEENKDFWDEINKIVEETAELIDEEIPLVKGETFSVFDDLEFDEDVKEAMEEHEKIREKAKKQEVSKMALKYEKAVDNWFKEREKLLNIQYHKDRYGMNVSYPGILDEAILKKLSNAIEVANWYQIQIWVKLQRALAGFFEDQEDPDFFEDFPLKDADGSAFVVLTGIDRSLGAWNYLYRELLPERESIRPMIRMLMWLRQEVEKKFPKARTFEWPPKWD